MGEKRVVCVVGLGYVGLPLAVEFSKEFKTIGFDINRKRIDELKKGHDRLNEVSKTGLSGSAIEFTCNPKDMAKADFIVVAVPTPINDEDHTPDLSYVESASEIIGKNLRKGSIVVYESTVYPGVTEDICVPIIEKNSGLKCGTEWKIGYSPERINPGDKERKLPDIKKIVSGMDKETLKEISDVYSKIIKAGVHEAKSIKVAEAAKVIENTQRDLNIALVNELALIFSKMGIKTKDVLEAAGTKWNFHKYSPGLVGGHCISVDPHYLVHKAQQLGYTPKVILSGREVSDYMPIFVAENVINDIKKTGKSINSSRVLVLGLAFKENVKDTRNSKIKHTISFLKKNGVSVDAYDPLIDSSTAREEFGVENIDLSRIKESMFDGVILATSHDHFRNITLDELKRVTSNKPVLFDIRNFFDEDEAKSKGFLYRSL